MQKKLNSKGFTLIELLAVIVILALVLILTIPNVLNAMNNSRVSSLHSKAKSVANWYSESVLADGLTTSEADKIIPTSIANAVTSSWKCLGDASFTSGGTSLITLAELNNSDFVLTETSGTTLGNANPSTANVKPTTCSAIRKSTGGKIEIILVATGTGKFAVGGTSVVYAWSEDITGTKVSG